MKTKTKTQNKTKNNNSFNTNKNKTLIKDLGAQTISITQQEGKLCLLAVARNANYSEVSAICSYLLMFKNMHK